MIRVIDWQPSLAVATLVVAACAAAAAARASAAEPAPQVVEKSMHEFMEYVYQPAYKRLQPAMAAAPADAAGWKVIKGESLVMAEAANLLLDRAPDVDGEDWKQLAVEVRMHGGELYAAAKKKDFAAARSAYETMLKSCNGCHDQFHKGKPQLAPQLYKMFFTLDGIDGVGKSTQMKLLVEWLRGVQSRGVVTCRDPGSTPLGEAVRGILLGHHETPICMHSEMLLYMAARAQLVDEVIRPALDAGQIVVSDRYLLANVVYQGYGGGLDIAELWTVGGVAVSGVMPTRTVLLDLDPALAMRRLSGAPDRMEKRGVEFLTRVRDGFLTEARRQPSEIAVVDASRSIDEIQADVRRRVAEVLAS